MKNRLLILGLGRNVFPLASCLRLTPTRSRDESLERIRVAQVWPRITNFSRTGTRERTGSETTGDRNTGPQLAGFAH